MATTTGHGLLTLSSEIKNNPINVDPIKGQNYDCHAVLFIHSGGFLHLQTFFTKSQNQNRPKLENTQQIFIVNLQPLYSRQLYS